MVSVSTSDLPRSSPPPPSSGCGFLSPFLSQPVLPSTLSQKSVSNFPAKVCHMANPFSLLQKKKIARQAVHKPFMKKIVNKFRNLWMPNKFAVFISPFGSVMCQLASLLTTRSSSGSSNNSNGTNGIHKVGFQEAHPEWKEGGLVESVLLLYRVVNKRTGKKNNLSF